MLTRRLGLLASFLAIGIAAGDGTAASARPGRREFRAGRAQAEATKRPPAVLRIPRSARSTPRARWAYGMDYETGATLMEKQADDEMPPSSMTKLMTVYLVYERLKHGRLKLEDELPVSEKAWRTQGSKMFVPIGTSVKVEDLIRGVIVQSGNDAAIVLAEAIGGSEDGFVELMNKKAQELGLTHTLFKNCTGWPDPEQHMSCRDIAILAGRIIRDFPGILSLRLQKNPSATTGSSRATAIRWCSGAPRTA